MPHPKDLILLEYERSSEFCNHVDNVRNVITSFFLTLAGAGAIAASVATKTPKSHAETIIDPTLATFALPSISILALLFVMVLARIRRVQLERYRIMNNIIDNTLLAEQRTIIPFSNHNAPDLRTNRHGSRTTGSYIWTLAILLPASAFAGLAIYIACMKYASHTPPIVAAMTATICGIGYIAVGDRVYFNLTKM